MFGEWAFADMVRTNSQVEWHHLEEEELCQVAVWEVKLCLAKTQIQPTLPN